MIPKFLQPPCHVVICLVLADIIDKQSADSTPVVCRCDGSVALLPCGIPNLSLDSFRINLDGSCGELDADGRLRIEIEFVSRESTQ